MLAEVSVVVHGAISDRFCGYDLHRDFSIGVFPTTRTPCYEELLGLDGCGRRLLHVIASTETRWLLSRFARATGSDQSCRRRLYLGTTISALDLPGIV